jgi:hypothetical protein
MLDGSVYPDNMVFALRWRPLRQWGLADLEDCLALECATEPVRLVIIDPLDAIFPLPAQNWNKNRLPGHFPSEPAFFLPLRQLAASHRLAILLLHHLPISGQADQRSPLVGTSPTGLTTATACNMLLTADGTRETCTLLVAGSEVGERRLTLLRDHHAQCWNFVEE